MVIKNYFLSYTQAGTVQQFVPGPVRQISVSIDSKHLSVTLRWERPENCTFPGDIKHYHINYAAMVFSQITSTTALFFGSMMDAMDAQMTSGSLQVLGSTTQVTIERSDGLQPMLEYTFEIRAESQEGRLGGKSEVTAYLGMSMPQCLQYHLASRGLLHTE